MSNAKAVKELFNTGLVGGGVGTLAMLAIHHMTKAKKDARDVSDEDLIKLYSDLSESDDEHLSDHLSKYSSAMDLSSIVPASALAAVLAKPVVGKALEGNRDSKQLDALESIRSKIKELTTKMDNNYRSDLLKSYGLNEDTLKDQVLSLKKDMSKSASDTIAAMKIPLGIASALIAAHAVKGVVNEKSPNQQANSDYKNRVLEQLKSKTHSRNEVSLPFSNEELAVLKLVRTRGIPKISGETINLDSQELKNLINNI